MVTGAVAGPLVMAGSIVIARPAGVEQPTAPKPSARATAARRRFIGARRV